MSKSKEKRDLEKERFQEDMRIKYLAKPIADNTLRPPIPPTGIPDPLPDNSLKPKKRQRGE
jgi:hypothetical protein